MVAALAISGRLDFKPLTDTLLNDKGKKEIDAWAWRRVAKRGLM
jgi:aconitate hydratase